MGIYVNPGNNGFAEIDDADYVDKTMLIELINRTVRKRNKLTCISRPRRFGKSYAAKMLCAYYDCSCDSHELFDNKNIARSESYLTYLNHYNVIYLEVTSFVSAANRQSVSLREVPNMIVDALHDELVSLHPELPKEKSLADLLIRCVEQNGGEPFVFIIDEWDALIREAKDDETAQKIYLDLLREWFKNGNFTPKVVAAAYMTGILPIKKDGRQSAVSEFDEFTMLDPFDFAEYVGFTEKEVMDRCTEKDMDYEEVKAWYDGYEFPAVGSVYNPYSVMNALRTGKCRSYWRKTSAAESLKNYINMDFEGLQATVARLIAGERIPVNADSFQNDFETFESADDVLTLLIHLGYLTYDEEEQAVQIPNKEVRIEFRQGGVKMAKKLLVGTDIFDKLIKSNGYYVDKTEILYELVEEMPNEVTLFTRPRRFGKTLTMSMLESFFDIRRNSRDVFEGLAVMKHTKFCAEYMNRYPVLFISLKDVEGLTFEKAYGKLKTVIANLCKKHAYLESGENVLPSDIELFHKLQYETADVSNVENALITIMRMMDMVYKMPVILLIDEYDVPLAKAHSNGYYQKMLDVIRGIMSISLKTNEYLKFAVVTGCLRIPKESIFTGVNNFASYSVLEEEFSQYFGFTRREMKELLDEFGQSDKTDAIREWYDGYVFGNIEIYCPWDAVSYVRDLLKRRNAKPRPYWENTSGNDAVKAFFEMENADISDKFERLLNKETITESVTNALTYEEAFASESNLWSVLLMTGYVTCVRAGEPAEDEAGGIREVELRIPNREIAVIFQRSVVDHFNRRVDENQIRELMQAMWSGDEERASKVLSDLLWHTISYMDYHEDYYHAFVTGIFVGRGGYAVRSNKERGLGRPDVDLRDKKNRRAMIIEAKKSENESRMEYWCDEALRQIADNEYAREMDGYTSVLCYGIAFFEKSARVKLMK